MTAQIISLQQKRKERGLPPIYTAQPWWVEAGLMLNPVTIAWLAGLTFAERFNTQPAIVLEFTDDGA